MFKDNNTVSTVNPCSEVPIPTPTLCDKCHLLVADAHENIIYASRIHEVLLGGNKNAANERSSKPSSMDEELTLIHEELLFLRNILIDISERL